MYISISVFHSFIYIVRYFVLLVISCTYVYYYSVTMLNMYKLIEISF